MRARKLNIIALFPLARTCLINNNFSFLFKHGRLWISWSVQILAPMPLNFFFYNMLKINQCSVEKKQCAKIVLPPWSNLPFHALCWVRNTWYNRKLKNSPHMMTINNDTHLSWSKVIRQEHWQRRNLLSSFNPKFLYI